MLKLYGDNGKFDKKMNEPANILVSEDYAKELRNEALSLPSLTLTRRQICDLELLINGGFTPLTGFMDQEAYESVLEHARLPDGSVWPIPVVLDVTEAFARGKPAGGPRNRQGITLFFTGLSGSGKSTLANIVFAKLIESGQTVIGATIRYRARTPRLIMRHARF